MVQQARRIVSSAAIGLFAVVGLASCQPQPYRAEEMARVGAQEPAAILISDAQVYSREALINERREQVEFIDSLLAEMQGTDSDKFDALTFYNARFKPQLLRELSEIQSLRTALGIKVNPLAGRSAEDQAELASLQQEIEVERKKLELERAKKALEDFGKPEPKNDANGASDPSAASGPEDADGAPTGDSSSGAANDGNGEAGSGSLSPPDAKDLLGDIKDATAELRKLLEQQNDQQIPAPTASTAVATPQEIFRDLQAYRSDLYAARNAVKLDDLHDHAGRALYRMQFDATVLPGAQDNRWGALRLTLLPPRMTHQDAYNLYNGWLSHLSRSINIFSGDVYPITEKSNGKPQYFKNLVTTDRWALQEARATNNVDLVPVTFCLLAGQGRLGVQIAAVQVRPSGDGSSQRFGTRGIYYNDVIIDKNKTRAHNNNVNEFCANLKISGDAMKGSASPEVLEALIYVPTPYDMTEPIQDFLHTLVDAKQDLYDLPEGLKACETCPPCETKRSDVQPKCEACMLRQTSGSDGGADCEACVSCQAAGSNGQPNCRACVSCQKTVSDREPDCRACISCQTMGSNGEPDCRACISRQSTASNGASDCETCVSCNTTSAVGQPECEPCDLCQRQGADGQNECGPCDSCETNGADGQPVCVGDCKSCKARRYASRVYAARLVASALSAVNVDSSAEYRLRRARSDEFTRFRQYIDGAFGLVRNVENAYRTHLEEVYKTDGKLKKYIYPVQTYAMNREIYTADHTRSDDVTEFFKNWGGEPCNEPYEDESASKVSFLEENEGGTILARFMKRVCRDAGPNAAFSTYSVEPVEYAQRQSVVASAAASFEGALALAAALPEAGANGDLRLGYLRQVAGKADALQRVPLVVGFREQRRGQSRDLDTARSEASAPSFGWLFGPTMRLDESRKLVALEHRPITYPVAADVVAPSWWSQIRMRVESAWISRWSEGPNVFRRRTDPLFCSARGRDAIADEGTARQEESRFFGLLSRGRDGPRNGRGRNKRDCDWEGDMIVDLPRSGVAFEGLTSYLLADRVESGATVAKIRRVIPERFSACSKEQEFIVEGLHVWRAAEVYLGGVEATRVRVLPDMRGVRATFNVDRLFSLNGAGNADAKGAVPLELVVTTRNGIDTAPVTLVGARSGASGAQACSSTGAYAFSGAPRPEPAPKPKPNITNFEPNPVKVCNTSTTAAVISGANLSLQGEEAPSVTLGAAKGEVQVLPSGGLAVAFRHDMGGADAATLTVTTPRGSATLAVRLAKCP